MKKILLLNGKAEEVLDTFPDKIIQTVVTSPPYWNLRDYFDKDQLGQEETPWKYVDNLVNIFRKVRRVLRDDGTVWLNIGDAYNTNSGFVRAQKDWQRNGRIKGSADRKLFKSPEIKRKDLFGLPWLVAFALRNDGWYLRCDVIYNKSNPMPDGAKDRPTHGHEYLFLFSKSEQYYYDYFATLEDTKNHPEGIQGFGANEQHGTFRMDQERVFEHYGKRNKRSVWTVSVANFKGKHYATFPPKLIEPCISGSTSAKGCCPKCLSPWKRIFEKTKKKANNKKGYVLFLDQRGWEPTCKCGIEETRGCLVLDPFSGMATTGLVAGNYNQDYIGIELNKEYLSLSRSRLEDPKLVDGLRAEMDNIHGMIN